MGLFSCFGSSGVRRDRAAGSSARAPVDSAVRLAPAVGGPPPAQAHPSAQPPSSFIPDSAWAKPEPTVPEHGPAWAAQLLPPAKPADNAGTGFAAMDDSKAYVVNLPVPTPLSSWMASPFFSCQVSVAPSSEAALSPPSSVGAGTGGGDDSRNASTSSRPSNEKVPWRSASEAVLRRPSDVALTAPWAAGGTGGRLYRSSSSQTYRASQEVPRGQAPMDAVTKFAPPALTEGSEEVLDDSAR